LKSVDVAPAKIRFGQLPNTSLECKLYTVLLDSSFDKNLNVKVNRRKETGLIKNWACGIKVGANSENMNTSRR
jgi:hypothetical protein